MSRKSPEDLEVEARVRGHLRAYMDRRKITATELARRIGADDGNITRILSGERGVSAGQILRICRALHIDPGTILEEDAPEQYRDPENGDPPAKAPRVRK